MVREAPTAIMKILNEAFFLLYFIGRLRFTVETTFRNR